MEHDDLALDWVGVDGTSILSLIFPLDVGDLQIPLLDVRLHNAESKVVNDSPVFVRQRYWLVIQPRHLLVFQPQPICYQYIYFLRWLLSVATLLKYFAIIVMVIFLYAKI